jgi:hypothetical protein
MKILPNAPTIEQSHPVHPLTLRMTIIRSQLELTCGLRQVFLLLTSLTQGLSKAHMHFIGAFVGAYLEAPTGHFQILTNVTATKNKATIIPTQSVPHPDTHVSYTDLSFHSLVLA